MPQVEAPEQSPFLSIAQASLESTSAASASPVDQQAPLPMQPLGDSALSNEQPEASLGSAPNAVSPADVSVAGASPEVETRVATVEIPERESPFPENEISMTYGAPQPAQIDAPALSAPMTESSSTINNAIPFETGSPAPAVEQAEPTQALAFSEQPPASPFQAWPAKSDPAGSEDVAAGPPAFSQEINPDAMAIQTTAATPLVAANESASSVRLRRKCKYRLIHRVRLLWTQC